MHDLVTKLFSDGNPTKVISGNSKIYMAKLSTKRYICKYIKTSFLRQASLARGSQ